MSRVPLTDDGIRALLAEQGYDVTRIAEHLHRGQLRVRARTMPFYVRVDPAGYIVCAVAPLLASPAEPERAERLYLRMMALNHQFMMAKLSIDDDLDVVLSVEYPSADLDPSELSDAMRVLAHYADQHHGELEAIAKGARPAARPSEPPPPRAKPQPPPGAS